MKNTFLPAFFLALLAAANSVYSQDLELTNCPGFKFESAAGTVCENGTPQGFGYIIGKSSDLIYKRIILSERIQSYNKYSSGTDNYHFFMLSNGHSIKIGQAGPYGFNGIEVGRYTEYIEFYSEGELVGNDKAYSALSAYDRAYTRIETLKSAYSNKALDNVFAVFSNIKAHLEKYRSFGSDYPHNGRVVLGHDYNYEAKLNRLRAEYYDKDTNHRNEILKIKSDHDLRAQKAVDTHIIEIERLENEHSVEIERLENEYLREKNSLSNEIDKYKAFWIYYVLITILFSIFFGLFLSFFFLRLNYFMRRMKLAHLHRMIDLEKEITSAENIISINKTMQQNKRDA